MSNINELPKQLPSSEYNFTVEIEGNITKKKYLGEFTFKIPNNRVQSQIAKTRAILNGGLENSLDIATLNIHQKIAYLKNTIILSPDWWQKSESGLELYDSNILDALYEKCLDCEEAYMKAIWGEDFKSE